LLGKHGGIDRKLSRQVGKPLYPLIGQVHPARLCAQAILKRGDARG
jgi:hypothetical protein